uniref:NADH-ubiquinone oxidoreductase chain 6 n=1 Tax=Branchinecta paludosa TaxID=111186 RepID=A0A8K1MHH6_9CRUS|nr:NADH dehydrogenase subunit 6 [Branchinecta paludosa]
MFSFLMILTGLFMMFFNHPLSFTLALFFQTIYACSMILESSSWIPPILFLIFLGGILVMFMYVASMSANESFEFEWKNMAMSLPLLSLLWIFSLGDLTADTSMRVSMTKALHKITTVESSILYMSLTVYLFIALLVVVDFLLIDKKPLRSLI